MPRDFIHHNGKTTPPAISDEVAKEALRLNAEATKATKAAAKKHAAAIQVGKDARAEAARLAAEAEKKAQGSTEAPGKPKASSGESEASEE